MPEISPAAVRAVVSYCKDALPERAHGYLLASDLAGPVVEFRPETKAVGAYRFDPVELASAKKTALAQEMYVIGVAFSRPGGPVWPSVDDVLAARQMDQLGTLMIVMVDPTSGEIGRFRILDGQVEPLS